MTKADDALTRLRGRADDGQWDDEEYTVIKEDTLIIRAELKRLREFEWMYKDLQK